jgi:hypothetical protein
MIHRRFESHSRVERSLFTDSNIQIRTYAFCLYSFPFASQNKTRRNSTVLTQDLDGIDVPFELAVRKEYLPQFLID